MAEERPILEVRNLKKYFKTLKGILHVVDDASSNIQCGKTLDIAGESGCGKSTTGRIILRSLELTSDEVFLEGRDILGLSKDEMRQMRQKMQVIFQDPYPSLNPRMTISDIIAEPSRLHKLCPGSADCERRVEHITETAGLMERLINSHPHEPNDDRRQRVGIIRMLVLQPSFVACGELVSALGVSIQTQILNLMQDLQEQLYLAYILITRSLSVANYLVDEITVTYLDQVMEKAPAIELFEHPQHPYIKALLSAIPAPSLKKRIEIQPLTEEISSPINSPQTCRFTPCCPYACDRCTKGVPELRHLGDKHCVACCLCQQWPVHHQEKGMHVDQKSYQNHLAILKSELIVALGYIEPVTIALAAVKTRETLSQMPEHCAVRCSRNIIKNVKGVVVPKSQEIRGMEAAAALDIVSGDASQELAVLESVEGEDMETVRRLLVQGSCTRELAEGVENFYIPISVSTESHDTEVEIKDYRSNIMKVVKDGAVLCSKDEQSETEDAKKDDKTFLNLKNILEFADCTRMEDIEETISRQIACNTTISEEGLKDLWGAQVGRMFMESSREEDIKVIAAVAAVAGSDVHMSSCSPPVVISSGSGNQGITIVMPVVAYVRRY